MSREKELLAGKKAVIFDLDGTLVDSMWIWPSIDVAYLGQFHLSLPEDLQSAIEGMSFTETACYFKERFGISDSIEEIKSCWNRMAYQKYAAEVPLKAGAGAFLEWCRKQGIVLGIASSNSRELVQVVLEALGVSAYFHVVATSCEVAAGKPAPDIYLHVADKLGIEPKDCLVFEDVTAGILAGKRAGMQVIGVEDAFSAADRAQKCDLADGYILDYTELCEE